MLVLQNVHHARNFAYKIRPFNIGWHVGLWNFVGGIGFNDPRKMFSIYDLFTADGKLGWIGTWHSHLDDDSMPPIETPIADRFIDETRVFISTSTPHRVSLNAVTRLQAVMPTYQIRTFNSAVVTACKHAFCKECVMDVLSNPITDPADEGVYHNSYPFFRRRSQPHTR
ncbi:hypothetical protein MD484_g8076, partial [Candolleomyces efflorescens]